MMQIKAVDIIIVNFNSTDYVINCLISCRNLLEKDIKAIIIDNASNDVPERILDEFPNIKLIRNNKNIGFSKAVNIGLKRSTADFVIVLNPDTILLDGFYDHIFKFLMKNECTCIVGPQIFDIDGKVQGSARRFPTFLTSIFGRKSPLTKLFPNNPISKKEFLCFNDQSNSEVEVDWVSGACMVLNRNAVLEIGGFDERFFLYWEDADLCKRVQEIGMKVFYLPKAQIVHAVGKSSSNRPFISVLHFHHSCFKLVAKYAKSYRKIIIPIALLGLTTRCLFVLSLCLITTGLNRTIKR